MSPTISISFCILFLSINSFAVFAFLIASAAGPDKVSRSFLSFSSNNLVRAEALDLGIRVHLAHRRVRLDLVRADREGAAGDAGRRDGAAPLLQGRSARGFI